MTWALDTETWTQSTPIVECERTRQTMPLSHADSLSTRRLAWGQDVALEIWSDHKRMNIHDSIGSFTWVGTHRHIHRCSRPTRRGPHQGSLRPPVVGSTKVLKAINRPAGRRSGVGLPPAEQVARRLARPGVGRVLSQSGAHPVDPR